MCFENIFLISLQLIYICSLQFVNVLHDNQTLHSFSDFPEPRCVLSGVSFDITNVPETEVINRRDQVNDREHHEGVIQWLPFCIFYSQFLLMSTNWMALLEGLRSRWILFLHLVYLMVFLQLFFWAFSANVCACLQKPHDEWPRMLNLTQNIFAGEYVQKWLSEGDQLSHNFLVFWTFCSKCSDNYSLNNLATSLSLIIIPLSPDNKLLLVW